VTDPVEGTIAAPVDRPALATAVVGEILRLADVPATLDVKDTPDGGISIALVLGEEVPGVTAGRRGTFVDALQFLVNKLTHRPGTERRWVSLGLGEHPAPRGARPQRPAAEANGAPRPPAPARVPVPPRPPVESPAPVQRSSPVDAPEVEVAEDAELTRAARAMAEASARAGRFFGVVGLSAEDRTRIVRAVAGVAGVRAGVEGEGRLRRLVFTPDTPTPMPRRAHPHDVDDVDEDPVPGNAVPDA
jgi:predicted RNA-binding protein Jag